MQHQTPSPTLVVEIGEQNPFNFSRDSGWFTEIERRRVAGRTRWLISVPSSSLRLARVQRLPAAPARRQSIYIRLSGRCASRIGQTSKLYGIFAQHSPCFVDSRRICLASSPYRRHPAPGWFVCPGNSCKRRWKANFLQEIEPRPWRWLYTGTHKFPTVRWV